MTTGARQFRTAILLGLLIVPAGFAVPLVLTAVTYPLWGFTAPDLVFGLVLNGQIALALAYFAVLSLVTVALPVAISWRLLRSARHAGITFLSSLMIVGLVQALGSALGPGLTMGMAERYAGMIATKEAERRTRIQVVSAHVEPADSLGTLSKYDGPAFQRLHLDLVLNCARTDKYGIRIHYTAMNNSGFDIYEDRQVRLREGRNSLVFDLSARNFALGGYWFRNGNSRVEVRVYQLVEDFKPLLAPPKTPGLVIFLEQEVDVPELTAHLR